MSPPALLFLRVNVPGALQNREIDRISHRFVTSGARMKVIARVTGRSQLIWALGIANSGIKVNDTVEGAARENPKIDSLSHRFALGAVVVGTFERRKSCSEHSDPMLMSAFDDLSQTHNEVLRADHLMGERSLLHYGAIR